MSNEFTTETRDVSDFKRVALRDYGELIISQGKKESLTIESEPQILEAIQTSVRGDTLDIRISASWLDKLNFALSTSLTRIPIKYTLVVKNLEALDILGAARVRIDGIESDRLAIVLGGAGEIVGRDLKTEQLDVDLRGAGRIELSGQADEQWITISGAGNYHAPDMATKETRVEVSGAGKATVAAKEELNLAIRGMGSVDYYGPGTVKRTISGLGSINHLGER
ncbi:MAG: head GIN domain-containing protein [Anaerolineales bacterium]